MFKCGHIVQPCKQTEKTKSHVGAYNVDYFWIRIFKWNVWKGKVCHTLINYKEANNFDLFWSL